MLLCVCVCMCMRCAYVRVCHAHVQVRMYVYEGSAISHGPSPLIEARCLNLVLLLRLSKRKEINKKNLKNIRKKKTIEMRYSLAQIHRSKIKLTKFWLANRVYHAACLGKRTKTGTSLVKKATNVCY